MSNKVVSFKKSIRLQMIAAAIVAVIAFFLAAFAAINWLLPKYYERNKINDLIGLYDELADLQEQGQLSEIDYRRAFDDEETAERLRALTEKNNLDFLILNSSNESVLASSRETERLREELAAYLFGHSPEGDVRASTDDYEIRLTKMKGPDDMTGQQLEMWGELGGGYTFIIRTPVESIRAAADLSNQFMFRLGILFLILAVLASWWYGSRVSRPISELAELSTRMSNLDFTAHYEGKETNEIGVLGQSFNQMSGELEKNITELKNANYTMQKDIERRQQQEQRHKEFVGNIAHELKTPIAVIQGYAEGLKEGVATDKESQDYYCDVIVDETTRMNQIIQNMMLLDQLEFGEEELDFERFNLTEVIKGLLMSMDILIRQKEAQITFLSEEEIYVWADEFMVEQVLSNYINNALNHLDGEKKIEIKIDKRGDKAHISVFNSGEPIPEEAKARIWDKFYKVDKARSRAYGGHGIGLSIVKAIMESLRQSYGVQNYENGVEFWFELAMK